MKIIRDKLMKNGVKDKILIVGVKNKILDRVAILSMCKFMVMSKRFCT